jgi:hypothetical protein
MRLRVNGGRMIFLDGAKPAFRRADRSPREELAEARAELARLEEWRVANTTWKTWPGSETPEIRRMEALKKKIHELDFIFNDSAPRPPVVTTIRELNERNAAFWETRR